jgi:hypothetical protein
MQSALLADATCYHRSMSKNIHVREVPTAVHKTLVARADAEGMSLSRYALRVLEQHCELPTVDEWLDEVDQLDPVDPGVSGAEAVRAARDEDDAVLGHRP